MNNLQKGLGVNGAFVTSESHSKKENRAGEIVTLITREGQRKYRYMKAQEAIAIGQVVSLYQFIDNADVDAAAAIGATNLKGTGDFTAGEFGVTFPSAFVSIDANTGANQTRAIEGNAGTADYLQVERNHGWDVALDGTSDYVTYDMNYVQLADSDEVPIVMGVAISAIASGEWGWFQVAGFCPLVRSAGGTDAIVAGEPVVVSSTAGVARGMTSGGSTVDETGYEVGYALHASAAADTAGAGVAVLLKLPHAAC
jgi:hypothetical protein